MDGFELADVIRQHPRFQKTAIIFISGVHLTDSDSIQGYRSGAVDYISVPVVPEVLRAKISIFVELHRKTRMLEALNNELEQRVAERTEELRKSEAQFRMRAELLELRVRSHHGSRHGRRYPVLECRRGEPLWLAAAKKFSARTFTPFCKPSFQSRAKRSNKALREQRVLARQSDAEDQRDGSEIVCRLPQDHES